MSEHIRVRVVRVKKLEKWMMLRNANREPLPDSTAREAKL
jgi:hypothetical protein